MRIALSVLLCLLFLPSWSMPPHRPLLDPAEPIAIRPVDLVDGHPELNRLGQLAFLRGYLLSSRDPAFGGFSSLSLDGDAFTLLNDGGGILRFRLDGGGRMSAVRFGELPDGPAPGWEKRDRDSESMTRDPASGTIWVGFERTNQIWRYASGFNRAEAHAAPPGIYRWPENGGPESMARLRDGRFVVIAETRWSSQPGRVSALFATDPTAAPRRSFRFRYVPPGDFDPTDAAELPDGRLIVLHRHFSFVSGFAVRVALLDPRLIKPMAVVMGREIAAFTGPVIHDNFEGVAVQQEQDGTHIWIVSDDNQSSFQRTLLLEFRLLPDPGAKPGDRIRRRSPASS